MTMALTAGDWARFIQTELAASGQEPAPQEGREMVLHACGWQLTDYILHQNDPLATPTQHTLAQWLKQRQTGMPLAYILNGAWFWNDWWPVSPGVLIPRPDSEALVKAVLEKLPQNARVAEVGLGSGALLGSILQQRQDVTGVGIDIDPQIIQKAQLTFQQKQLSTRAQLVTGNLLEGTDGPFDVIFSNPPYIAEAEWATLEASVRHFEPKLALVGQFNGGNADGLAAYRALLPQALAKLQPNGWFVCEIGWQQAQGVQQLLSESWTDVTTLPDLAGRDRVIAARPR